MRVCLDVGSTNSRAWLVDGKTIVARETAPVGVRNSARDGSTARLREAIRDLVHRVSGGAAPDSVWAAGMITSPLGLLDVPHIVAPAAIEDLAAAVVTLDASDICATPIALVPGVRTAPASRSTSIDEALASDVMRGEETLVIGLLARGAIERGSSVLNAGSHWKLIRVDDTGRIAESRTTLGGEAVHAVQSSTLLAASLPDGPLQLVVTDWLEAGADARQRDGLLRALFGVRLLDQQGVAKPEQRFNFLVGACIADDVDALMRTGTLTPPARVHVAGPGAIPLAWVDLLRGAGIDAVPLDTASTETAFVTGLLEIARLRDRRV